MFLVARQRLLAEYAERLRSPRTYSDSTPLVEIRALLEHAAGAPNNWSRSDFPDFLYSKGPFWKTLDWIYFGLLGLASALAYKKELGRGLSYGFGMSFGLAAMAAGKLVDKVKSKIREVKKQMADEKKKEAERLKEERAKRRADYFVALNDLMKRVPDAKTVDECRLLTEEHHNLVVELKKKDPELYEALSVPNTQLSKAVDRRAGELSGRLKPRTAYLDR